MIIAIDGPAASGKGTVARRVAAVLGFAYLDTGLIYRAVARDVLRAGASLEDEAAATRAATRLDPATLDDPGLKAPGVGEAASLVAKVASVRRALLDFQRAFAARPPGAVLDGRDIGTVVCPDADLKLFVTADVEVRARRRYEELAAKGEDVSLERVLEIIRRRDARDSGRADAPMVAACDALAIDTTHMAVDAVVAHVLALVRSKGAA